MTISIIIPVFNVADYIEECLESVSTQTYSGQLECVLVDDCGSDNSIRLAQNFIENYSGPIEFRIVSHEKNKGLSASRNTGIRECKGDYVYFLDSDDTLTMDCLERITNVLEKYPDCELIQAGAIANQQLLSWFSMEKDIPDYSNRPEWILRTMLMRGGLRGFPVTAWNRLVKKDFLIDNNLFFKDGILHEDELWGFMLAQKVRHLGICRHDTYIYRIRENSIMTNLQGNDQKVYSLLDVWDEMLANIGTISRKTQIRMIWRHIDELYPLELSKEARAELRKRLVKLVEFNVFPVSWLIKRYLKMDIADLSQEKKRKKLSKWMHISVKKLSPLK